MRFLVKTPPCVLPEGKGRLPLQRAYSAWRFAKKSKLYIVENAPSLREGIRVGPKQDALAYNYL